MPGHGFLRRHLHRGSGGGLTVDCPDDPHVAGLPSAADILAAYNTWVGV